MHKSIYLVLALTIFCIGQTSADSAKNTESGITIVHADNRAAGWIDVELEDISGPQEANCGPGTKVIAASDKEVKRNINPADAHGFAQTSPLFTSSGLRHRQSKPVNKAAAKCVLKNINKARSDATARAVLKSCNVLHYE